MRKALNDNPTVQIAVLAVAGVILAFLLYTTVLSGEEEPAGGGAATPAATADGAPATPGAPATETPAPGAPATGAPATGAPAPGDAAGAPATPAPVTPAPAAPPAAESGAGLLPTKGLPADVLVAYAKGKAIALIVYDPEAISDRKVETYVNRLERRGDVEVFDVKVDDIAKYARITGGVNVTRNPALIVVRPRDRTGPVPLATVSYGFRSAKSVEIAVEGALYTGGPRSISPE